MKTKKSEKFITINKLDKEIIKFRDIDIGKHKFQ